MTREIMEGSILGENCKMTKRMFHSAFLTRRISRASSTIWPKRLINNHAADSLGNIIVEIDADKTSQASSSSLALLAQTKPASGSHFHEIGTINKHGTQDSCRDVEKPRLLWQPYGYGPINVVFIGWSGQYYLAAMLITTLPISIK
mmetsp:Transcript_29431/g.55715  ORF Transcript_29431/g.55715 Transcript_29431/m.55715 type:complete len:146 (+) Transcript_29431:4396-4833(+)